VQRIPSYGHAGLWLVLDGAHTPGSAQALATTLRSAFPNNPLALVIAMADDKDHEHFLAALYSTAPVVVIFTSVPIASSSARCIFPNPIAGRTLVPILDCFCSCLMQTSSMRTPCWVYVADRCRKCELATRDLPICMVVSLLVSIQLSKCKKYLLHFCA
jgi:Mur ligase family, glutamate ligase domain